MAQELADRIRAAAQARGIDPELAVRIAQAESSLNPAARAKTSSAAGLFQVTDDTWRRFGGKPGKKLDADENIRVGLDIIDSNTRFLKSTLGTDPAPAQVYAAHFFGPSGAKSVLTAPSDAAIEQLLSKSALKANPQLQGKTAGQVVAMLEGKVGPAKASSAVPRETPDLPDPAQQQMEQAFRSGLSAQAAPARQDLGAGYQAALALSVLADENEKEGRDPDETPSISEEWLAQQAARPAALAELGEIKIKSPFAQGKPVMLAEGGEVKEPGLLSVPGYSETVAREMYPGEQGQFDKQDAARHMLAAGTLARKYGPTAAEMLGKLHEITTSPGRWLGSKIGISQMPVDYEQDLHNNRIGIELGKRSRSQKDLEDLILRAAEEAKSAQEDGKPWIGRPQRPVKRAEGGEIGELTPEEIEKASKPAFLTPSSGRNRKISANSGQINDAALQGLSELPYNIAGAPVDLATLALRAAGYDEKSPVMGSDWIKEKMTRLGIRPEPPKEPAARAIYEVTQAGSSLINPAGAARGAARTAEKTGEAAKMLARDFQDYNRQLSAPGASYVVRAPGGEFPTTGSVQVDDVYSNLDKSLKSVVDAAQRSATAQRLPDEHVQAVTDLFDKKLRSFYRSQAGSVSDPVREAIIAGKIKFKKDSPEEDMFPQALIDAARSGDVTAMRAIERSYDEAMGVKAFRIADENEHYAVPAQAQEQYRQFLLREMATNPSTIPDSMLLRLTTKNADKLPAAEQAKRVAEIRAKMAENPAWFANVLEPKMERLIGSDPLATVAPSSVASYPNLYQGPHTVINSPHYTKGPGAGTAERPVLDLGYQGARPFGLDTGTLIDTALGMSTKELRQTSVPDFLARAVKQRALTQEAETFAGTAERLAKAGRPIPERVAFFGTKQLTAPDTQGMQWREITDPSATLIHSAMLDNSIRGYARAGTYGALSKGSTALQQGEVRLFGLYDKNNNLVTNVEYVTPKVQGYNADSITQFYGNGPRTGNVLPENYVPQVQELLNTLRPKSVPPSIKSLLQSNGIYPE